MKQFLLILSLLSCALLSRAQKSVLVSVALEERSTLPTVLYQASADSYSVQINIFSPMIRCLAVDDEAYAVKIIAYHIAKIPFLQLVGTTTSAMEALARVQRGEVDLVFLDIQMPELTGIQFLKLCGSKCKVILTTA